MKLDSAIKVFNKFLLGLCLTLGSWSTGAADYIANKHYQILEQPITVANNKKIVVNEFFGYPCPHCNQFEPLLHPWTRNQGADVTFIPVPVVFNRSWELYAKAYYIAHQLEVFEQAHQRMYDALHIHKRQMTNRKTLMEFFTELGITEEDFAAAYDSFDLKNKLRQASKLTLRAKIPAVPSMLVNGKYLITAQMAGGQSEMLAVADFLISQARQQQSE
jgi:thiol:disulfide interchange protein DsbA